MFVLDLHQADILQLSATCGENKFNVYITPQLPIYFQNRFSMSDQGLCLDGQPVNAESSAREAFRKFICWLRKFDDQVILLAHNGKIFDAPRLILKLQDHGLLEDFKANVIGFIDTLIMFQNHFSLEKKPSLEELVVRITPNYEYEEHDSSEDVRVFKVLLEKTSAYIEEKLFDDASFSLEYEIAYVEHAKERYENNETLLSLPITKGMKKKIAESGLQYCDLQLAYEQAGKAGIEIVLSDKSVNGKPRVTKNKRIISEVYDHFNVDKL